MEAMSKLAKASTRPDGLAVGVMNEVEAGNEACEWDSAEEGMWIEREGIAMIT